MKTAFRFRLYPSHKQEPKLMRMVEAARRLWEEKRLSTSYRQQCWTLTAEMQAMLDCVKQAFS